MCSILYMFVTFCTPTGNGAVETECPARTYWLMTKLKVTKIEYTWTITGFTNQVCKKWSGIIGPTIYVSMFRQNVRCWNWRCWNGVLC